MSTKANAGQSAGTILGPMMMTDAGRGSTIVPDQMGALWPNQEHNMLLLLIEN